MNLAYRRAYMKESGTRTHQHLHYLRHIICTLYTVVHWCFVISRFPLFWLTNRGSNKCRQRQVRSTRRSLGVWSMNYDALKWQLGTSHRPRFACSGRHWKSKVASLTWYSNYVCIFSPTRRDGRHGLGSASIDAYWAWTTCRPIEFWIGLGAFAFAFDRKKTRR